MRHTERTDEQRLVVGLGFVLGLRQLALLLPLPFISVYGSTLAHSTPALVGLSLGIYGLLQAMLQIPFGRWSDVWGRKRLVLIGTALLIAGLFLAAAAQDIATLIAARALQGMGAVTAIATAWIADGTAPEHRARAMGVASLATGAAAIFSFIAGPLFYRIGTMPQMFTACAALVTLVWLFLIFGVKADTPAAPSQAQGSVMSLLKNVPLRRFIFAGFLLNYIMMGVLFIVPLLIDETLGARNLWQILIPATVIGVAVMRFATRYADGPYFGRIAALSFAAFLLSALSFLLGHPIIIGSGMALFMAGYLILSALLPAGVTRDIAPNQRGAASGLFYTAQFLGAFSGGTFSGVLWGVHPSAAMNAVVIAAGLGLLVILRLSSHTSNPHADVSAE
ncbi:MAG: MFS transporter [Rhodospirillaceae bacterium]|nr:MFS transporter [Rhodospirillaceae bacterium]